MALHDILLEALNSSRSTIVVGNVGRYPELLEHALHTYWIPRGDPDDSPLAWFQYDGRDVYLLVEPDFGHVVDANLFQIILTSHMDLEFDTKSTRVVHLNVPTAQTRDPTTGIVYRVTSNDPREAYLELLTHAENCPRSWHYSVPKSVKDKWKVPLQKSKSKYKEYGGKNFKHYYDPWLDDTD
ncbi:hypothetical protein JTE90_022657 [Oedothorax gibbosus]|uniref:Uncharacterized protein n=1 Tax=Oedothorax gibbosus TaxID=931172 RepID=A0AAV6TEX2_9ARAC|nr:hypothetical protein JTE90_014810 [Oedothorax gibbosus]KAG8173226.1 hypothetical protein JTE90_023701 [Oedothorax gibbosus]KAG8174531.1 hypothetical protein JTE90_010599 [Oedothorax gibbosus]KAG8175234.1 hypothetical protein JTE90_022657 [Oedothorax gibbosus]